MLISLTWFFLKWYLHYFSGKRRYNIKLWKTFTDCFNCLPVAAIVDEKIFCCHGGLSPDLQSMEQIRRIMRPTDVPDQGLLCDLLWSDPDKVSNASFLRYFLNYLVSVFNGRFFLEDYQWQFITFLSKHPDQNPTFWKIFVHIDYFSQVSCCSI